MGQLQAQPLVLSDSQKNWVLLGVGLGVFMSTLDVGIINVGLVLMHWYYCDRCRKFHNFFGS
ncbi:MAG: hypothetical protein V7K55_21045 [Nostoc sp.]|uniref:hypothetical protein n=1 Tax=Nostoc sp. TaxID=1180 RepID=UPI002FF95617